jgi:alanyl-tRNA synthetase
LGIDRAGFESAMAQQKERARRSSFHTAADSGGEDFVVVGDDRESEFIGYDRLECDAEITVIRDAGAREGASRGSLVEFATDRTVFYPEGGGQVGDVGEAVAGGERLRVVDTRRAGNRIAHVAEWSEGDDVTEWFRSHRVVSLSVDRRIRYDTMRNHTATHALHAALRSVLGSHVAQAGSYVGPDRLRFDFHHFQALKPEQIESVEKIVNDVVMSDRGVEAQTMRYDEAVEAGAMALFGEKYGDTVRVVSIEDFSKELCGGTHLDRTGEIGTFVIRQESAVGSGIRRVEALTGRGALDYVKRLQRERDRIASMLKVAPSDVERRLRALLEEAEDAERKIRRLEEASAKARAGEALDEGVEIEGVRLVTSIVPAADVPTLRRYGDELRGKLGLGLAVLCQEKEEKPVCLVVASDRLIAERSVKATDITSRITASLSYRGGGKPHMAQFGIPDASEFARIESFVRSALEELLR